MSSLYLTAGVSKQGHFNAIKFEQETADRAVVYVGLMETIRDMHPGMGLRKMYEQFQPEGIGRDTFVALGLESGFRLLSPVSPFKTTHAVRSTRYKNLLVNKIVTGVDQVWVSDLFYFSLHGDHHYVVLIMDVFSRKIIGHCASDNMRAENFVAALKMALLKRGEKVYNGTLIHHSDRGVQYTSDDYLGILDAFGINVSMCTDVLENAHCERANGTIKNEYLARWRIQSFQHLITKLDDAVNNYNDRKHNTIKMSPNQFEIAILSESFKPDPMTIFTIQKTDSNVQQLSLFEGVTLT